MGEIAYIVWQTDWGDKCIMLRSRIGWTKCGHRINSSWSWINTDNAGEATCASCLTEDTDHDAG